MTDKRAIDRMLAEIEQFTEQRRQRDSGAPIVEEEPPESPPEPVPQAHGYQYTGSAIPRKTAQAPPEPQPSTHPTPHRPKGRLLTGFLLLGLFGFVGYQVWSSFFRYSAYGIVESFQVEVSAPTEGVVQSVHVRLGDSLRQGQLLLTLNNPELQHRLERTGDELRIEQARLSAESAKLHWQMRVQQLENDEAVAEYFEAWARLENEIANQQGLEQRFARAKKLHGRKILTSDQYEELLYERKGTKEKIKKRREALAAWRTRAEKASVTTGVSTDPIDPILAKMESLRAELIRVREMIVQCDVRSPVNGRLVGWELRPGEFAKQGEQLLTIVEEQSEYIRLFLSQEQHDRFAVNDTVGVEIRPHSGTIQCVVERLGDRFAEPPPTIRKYYAPNEKLLMVELRPVQITFDKIGIRTGAQVRLPKFLFADHVTKESKLW